MSNLLLAIREVDEVIHVEEEVVFAVLSSGGAQFYVIRLASRWWQSRPGVLGHQAEKMRKNSTKTECS